MKIKNILLTTAVLFTLVLCKKEYKNNQVSPADFLSNKKYSKLKIEIQSVKGFEPSATAIANIRAFLLERLNKSKGIEIVNSSINSPGKSNLTLSDISDIEKKNRNVVTEKSTITAYILFVDGSYTESNASRSILGVAYENSSMVIFENTIKQFSGGIGEPSESSLESAVSLHELGHILGLVNNGSAMANDHQDNANGKHCNNSKCLMYFNAETSDIVGNLLGGIPTLDAACIQDLQKNGGK